MSYLPISFSVKFVKIMVLLGSSYPMKSALEEMLTVTS